MLLSNDNIFNMSDFIREIVDKDFFYHHSRNSNSEINFFDLHMHDAFEIYMFMGGQARINIENIFYNLAPYDLCFIYPGRFHRVFPQQGENYERKVIRFDYSFCRQFDPNDTMISSLLNFNIIKGSDIKRSIIPKLFDEMNDFIILPENVRRIACLSNLGRLLMEISNICANSSSPEFETPSNERVASVIEFINNNLTEDLSLDFIASNFYISKFYLSKIFKENIGSTIGNFIIKKRLVLAKRLILGGSTPGTACIQSGFKDYSNFYKSYKKHFGVPPSIK